MLNSGALSLTPSAAGCNERHTITVYGDAQHSTAQSKIGSSSIKFDGTGDYLSIPNSADFNWGSNDWTIESWYYCTASSGNNNLCSTMEADATGIRLTYNAPTTTWHYGFGNNGSWAAGTGELVSGTGGGNNAWHHIALSKSSNVYRLFIDGVLKGTTTEATAIADVSTPFNISRFRAGDTSYFNGYMDEVRVSNTARYTSSFTPSTTAFTEDANTLLLIHSDTTNGSTTFVGCGHT